MLFLDDDDKMSKICCDNSTPRVRILVSKDNEEEEDDEGRFSIILLQELCCKFCSSFSDSPEISMFQFCPTLNGIVDVIDVVEIFRDESRGRIIVMELEWIENTEEDDDCCNEEIKSLDDVDDVDRREHLKFDEEGEAGDVISKGKFS